MRDEINIEVHNQWPKRLGKHFMIAKPAIYPTRLQLRGFFHNIKTFRGSRETAGARTIIMSIDRHTVSQSHSLPSMVLDVTA